MATQTFDMTAHEVRLDRIISNSFSASFMSNSKWRRFFLAIAAPDLNIKNLRWKFVGRDNPIIGAAPDADCLGELYITRTSFAAFPYKEIEWIEFPGLSELPPSVATIGKFETTMHPSGVRLYGYR
jgi:hypothetical protein